MLPRVGALRVLRPEVKRMGALEQFSQWQTDPFSQAVHVVNRDVAAAYFDLSDVRPSNATFLSEVFQSHSSLVAFFAKSLTESDAGSGGIALGFGHTVGWRVNHTGAMQLKPYHLKSCYSALA